MRWEHTFIATKRIVRRYQYENLMGSKSKQLLAKKSVSYHLEMMKRMFESCEVVVDDIEIADETYFVFNMDNGKTLGLIGDDQVKNTEEVSEGEPI